jgi:hypothetical protein
MISDRYKKESLQPSARHRRAAYLARSLTRGDPTGTFAAESEVCLVAAAVFKTVVSSLRELGLVRFLPSPQYS